MLPRGWWRPLALYGGMIAVILVLRGAREAWIYAAVAAGVAPLVAFVVLRNTLPVARFLRGMRDAGEEVTIVKDEMRWSGERRVLARTPTGEWRVECWAGNAIHLRVRGPAMARIREVKGSARKAGRACAGGALPRELLV